MKDILREFEAVLRETSVCRMKGGEGRRVFVRRRYDAEIEDVWDAITSPERLRRWFSPVTGDLRLGGSYQIEGNAGGTILRCEPPRLLALSWLMGGGDPDSSLVEVRLAEAGAGKTNLELEHTAIVPPEMWGQFGPGAVGVGWDLGLLGLALHLVGESVAPSEHNTWTATPEAREFVSRASAAWGAAHEASGASPAEAAAGAAATKKFYTPPDPPA
jgi:uncharacterized protein YndB with AHSA1/START domain